MPVPPPPPGIPPASAVSGVSQVPESVTAFTKTLIDAKVEPFVELTRSFATTPVIELVSNLAFVLIRQCIHAHRQVDLIAKQFQDVRTLILVGANCQQPDQKTKESLLTPLLTGIEEVTRAKEKNRKERDWFGHIAFLSEVGPHVGWVVSVSRVVLLYASVDSSR